VRWRVTRPSYAAVGRLTLWAEAARCGRVRGVQEIAGSERWTCLTAATRFAACPGGVGSAAAATCFHNDNSSGNGAGPLISGAGGGRGRARVNAKWRGQPHSRRGGCLSWGSPRGVSKIREPPPCAGSRGCGQPEPANRPRLCGLWEVSGVCGAGEIQVVKFRTRPSGPTRWLTEPVARLERFHFFPPPSNDRAPAHGWGARRPGVPRCVFSAFSVPGTPRHLCRPEANVARRTAGPAWANLREPAPGVSQQHTAL